MTPRPAPGRRGGGSGRSRTPPAGPAGAVVELDRRRIEQALRRRARYRYVQPHVARDGDGWRIASPNCSRSVDKQGGEIDIARFVPEGSGRWSVQSRDHAGGTWQPRASDLSLADALALVCDDADRVYWP